MDISKMKGSELQDVYRAGLSRMIPKESYDPNAEPPNPTHFTQYVPTFYGEPEYAEAIATNAPVWEPIRLVWSQPPVAAPPESTPTGNKKAA